VVFLAAPSQSGEMPCEFAHQIVSQGVAGMTLCREYVRPLDNFYPNTSAGYKWYRTVGRYRRYRGTYGTVVQGQSLIQRYQLWYVLESDELGAASAQCSCCS
jgi:hypothetical protein